MKMIRLVGVLLLLFPVVPLAAHPHVFINTGSRFVFGPATLQGLEVSWEFDEFFSGQVLEACDSNKDGNLSAAEQILVRKKFFANLKSFHYFTFVWINEKFHKAVRVSKFKARVGAGRKVTYTFFIPLGSQLEAAAKTVKVMYLDESNFVAFFSKDNTISVAGEKPTVVKAVNNTKAQYQITFRKK